jgi:hypothetical protein
VALKFTKLPDNGEQLFAEYDGAAHLAGNPHDE